MKRFSLLITAFSMVLVLAACGTNKTPEPTTDNTENDAMTDPNVSENETTGENGDNMNTNDDTVDHNGERRLDVADDVADKITQLDEVDRAYVILADTEAYVAIETNATGENANGTEQTDNASVSKDLETKIANEVRDANGDVEEVYVTLDPDFVGKVRDYQTRINEGEPIEGFFDEFGEAMRDIFPNAR